MASDEADLVTDHPSAFGDPLADVDQLDLVGIDHIDVGVRVGQRGDGHAAAFRLGQVGGELFTHLGAEHICEVPSFVRPAQLL